MPQALRGWAVAIALAFVAPAAASNTAVDAATIAEAPPSPPNMIRFGPEQGLSKSVNDLAIDRQGYVWVATIDGLARYDGTGFRHWRHDPKREDSLPSSNVMSIHADSQDRIWVATVDSLSVLGRDRRGFRHLRLERDAKACVVGVSVLKETRDGALWIGTLDSDLCRLDPLGNAVRFPLKSHVKSASSAIIPFSIYQDSSATLWVGTTDGLLRLKGGKIERHAESIIGREEISAISAQSETEFWVGTERSLYRVGVNGLVLEKIPDFPGGAIVVNDSKGGHWIGTTLGLYKHRFSSGEDRSQIAKNDENHFMGDDRKTINARHMRPILAASIFSLHKDQGNGLWVVGDVQGLSYLSSNSDRFITVKSFEKFNADWQDIVAVAGDESGRSWLLSGSTLYRFSSKTLRPEIIRDIRKIGIVGPRSVEICFGKVLVADRRGVVELDLNASRGKRLIEIRRDNLLTYPARLRCSKDRKIWISFFGGDLQSYSEDGRLLYRETAAEIFGHSTPGIVELSFHTDGSPWYTDDRDMYRWSGDRFVKVPLRRGARVSAFAFRAENELWISRLGVLERYQWNGRTLKFLQQIGEEEGMPLVDSEGMRISPSGNIWLTTLRGLLEYDPKQNRARLFGIHDGLPGTDFYYGPPVLLGPNRAVALSADGLAFFDPELGLEPAKPSFLSVESLSLRRDGGERTLDPSRPVRMLAGDRDLRVVPRLLSFSDPQSHRYRSRMHGEDPDWVLQQGPSERVFSRLPPGRYTLELQAANADGAWSKPVKLSIEVMPPWWRSAWALAVYVLLISALLWWLSYLDRLRLKRRHTYQLARQKRELAEQASDAKSRFLADLGHELRTPMTGVLGMSELLLAGGLDPRQHGQAQSIRRAGEHLLRLVDDALDLARVEAGRLELQRVEFGLDASIDEIAGLMSPLAARKGLRFSVERDQETPERWVGDPLRLKQIVLNLLGNAVK
ncbi:MAG: hypothetical protein KA144_01580, partial [Xanthomonadaceae bacterium]|nr:hypothetical protein [Xanthomonadaceae bacterium]